MKRDDESKKKKATRKMCLVLHKKCLTFVPFFLCMEAPSMQKLVGPYVCAHKQRGDPTGDDPRPASPPREIHYIYSFCLHSPIPPTASTPIHPTDDSNNRYQAVQLQSAREPVASSPTWMK